MKPLGANFGHYPLNLPYMKVKAAKDHGKNYEDVRPLLVRHPFLNRLKVLHLQTSITFPGRLIEEIRKIVFLPFYKSF